MGRDIVESNASARAVFDEVSEAAGLDVAALCFDSDEETLRRTDNAQLALYCCGVACWRALSDSGCPAPGGFAGHSVGEYAALASAGIVSIAAGAKLVKRRGELMLASGKSRPGTMAAVLGVERDRLESLCQLASKDGVVVVANDNCPGQLVVSGDVDAVQKLSQLATEAGAKRVLPLNVSGAFHSPLMNESASAMREALDAAQFGSAAAPVYSNVTAGPVSESTSWPDLLERQLKSPVLWTDSVRRMNEDGIQAIVECGSGEVLSGLLRRIAPEMTALKVVDGVTLEQTMAALAGVAA